MDEGSHTQFLFPAGCRILNASDGISQCHPADAPLIAGDTVTDILIPSFTGLVGQLRVGDQGPNHIDHIPLTVLQDLFRQAGVIDAAFEKEMKKLLGIPKDLRIICTVAVGYPTESPTKNRRPLSEMVSYEKY